MKNLKITLPIIGIVISMSLAICFDNVSNQVLESKETFAPMVFNFFVGLILGMCITTPKEKLVFIWAALLIQIILHTNTGVVLVVGLISLLILVLNFYEITQQELSNEEKEERMGNMFTGLIFMLITLQYLAYAYLGDSSGIPKIYGTGYPAIAMVLGVLLIFLCKEIESYTNNLSTKILKEEFQETN